MVTLKRSKQGQLDCVTNFYIVYILFTEYNSLYDNSHAVYLQ